MIGVDSNVLVRLFIVDEPQSRMAATFFAARTPADPAFVSLVALAEFGWVLRKKYRLPPERIASAVQGMLDTDDFMLEQRPVVEWVLEHYRKASVDLSDLLIACVNARAGASPTVTFDATASRRIAGMELLK